MIYKNILSIEFLKKITPNLFIERLTIVPKYRGLVNHFRTFCSPNTDSFPKKKRERDRERGK